MCGVKGERTVLLGKLFTVGAQDQRGVQVLWGREIQACLQAYLARGVVSEVFPAYDMADALFGVVNNHRELVAKAGIRALQHKVTYRLFKVLALGP